MSDSTLTLGQMLKNNKNMTFEQKCIRKEKRLCEESYEFRMMYEKVDEYLECLKEKIASDIVDGEDVIRYDGSKEDTVIQRQILSPENGSKMEIMNPKSDFHSLGIAFSRWEEENQLTAKVVIEHDGGGMRCWPVVVVLSNA